MTEKDIREKLAQCTNLVELIGKSAELKREGAKPATVNRVVTEFRKKLVRVEKKSKNILRNPVSTEIPAVPIAYVGIEIEDLNAPVVKYNGDTFIL